MQSYEALCKAISGRTMEHAKRLGRSSSLVSKYQEPYTDFFDLSAYNPMDRIETIVDTALQPDISGEDALTPVYRLKHRFSLVFFDQQLENGSSGGQVKKVTEVTNIADGLCHFVFLRIITPPVD